jgi:signal transduction histidine kinase
MKIKFPKLSIFIKLVFIVVIFGILLNITVLLVFNLSSDKKPRKFLRDFSRRMERSLIYEVGIPPDPDKAKQICEDLQIDMRFEGKTASWTSDNNMPYIDDILSNPENKQRFEEDESIIVFHKRKPYSVIRFPQGVFIIKPFEQQRFFNTEQAIILLILFITLIIVLLYFLLRSLFSPLKELSAAVHSIGEGNYDVKLPEQRNDELGELSNSVSEMSQKISASIKSKEQLLIDVSHELRSPLTRIKLGLEVGSPKERIQEDIYEMEKMISSLLENYRFDAGYNKISPQITEISQLIKETADEYTQQNRLVLQLPPENIYVLADMDKMQIVFRNIIDNALKYSSDIVNISVKKQNNFAVIAFEDKGTGISQKDLNNIFEPFYRADPSRSRKTGGFGLGLSISKKIIDAHKGEISISSALNQGTKVVIKLKIAD